MRSFMSSVILRDASSSASSFCIIALFSSTISSMSFRYSLSSFFDLFSPSERSARPAASVSSRKGMSTSRANTTSDLES